jgi:HD-like signal output (HDOD) protein
MSATEETDWQIDRTLHACLTELGEERGLTIELGALRFVLLRLLQEDSDMTRLAGQAARVAGVAVQAAKAQGAMQSDDEDSFLSQMIERVGDMPTVPTRREA